MIIRDVIVTPIAFRDPPLLNAAGLHEPLALRSVVRLVVDGGIVGLGEGGGGQQLIRGLEAAGPAVVGKSVFDLNGIEAAINAVLGGGDDALARRDRRAVFSPIEVAAHDAQGKILGLPVSTLLGGAVRDRVPYSAYLFYKWAAHPDPVTGEIGEPDAWGEAVTPEGIVRQARTLIDRYGFESIKLKAGVFPPDEEIAAIRALAEAFPGYPLRIDPNGAWSIETAERVGRELGSILEYFEDPVLGLDGMSEVRARTGLPLATNMCVVAFEHVREAVEKDSVQIILGDHHYWGGLRRTRELGAICETFGIGMSMHSNSHLGISLAAMTHVAAATPTLTYACDTHYPWNREDDIVRPGALEITGGAIAVPTGPGLGVELDEDALERQHRVYLDSAQRDRDDAGYIRRFQPAFDPQLPRF
ncbi:glucarate dehydratase family protein [Microbacterium excoecariae]|uniref:glucarate dehydratase family protein n=1 Tax=Microbacterium excoecariae TaxID=2715210 RepID=UPI00140DF8BA|nr:glucarate dehydratase family protein [Microbacterium excoecariae]NHI16549.1 glucarate dehydratase [Microbacterium excoecariae]